MDTTVSGIGRGEEMKLLETSVTTALFIVGILTVRGIGRKRIPKRLIMYLWNLALIRALLPFQIRIKGISLVSGQTDQTTLQNFPINYSEVIQGIEKIQRVQGNLMQSSRNFAENWQEIFNLLWLMGAICLVFYFINTYRKEFKELKKSRPCSNQTAERIIQSQSLKRTVRLYQGSVFSVPVTYGVLRPKIVFPENIEGVSRVDIRNMTFHELIHIRRFDVVMRFLLAGALCIHWFNPFVWLLYQYYLKDQEISCDECVMKQMERMESKNYIVTMIKMSSKGRALLTTSGFWGREDGKRRILEAMARKEIRKGSVLIALALSFCFVASFLTIQSSVKESWIEQEEGQKKQSMIPKLANIGMALQIEPKFEQKDYKISVDENFDYFGVMDDIKKNYNDLTQEPTEDQKTAMTMTGNIALAKIYKERLEEGHELGANELWLIDEYYKYVRDPQE